VNDSHDAGVGHGRGFFLHGSPFSWAFVL
jgi:hypothetical protein